MDSWQRARIVGFASRSLRRPKGEPFPAHQPCYTDQIPSSYRYVRVDLQVVSISRSFDIAQTDVQLMLQYFHRRGRLVYFADDVVLSRLVVVNPTWFVQTLSRAVDGFERSLVDSAHLLQSLADKDLDRQLQVRTSYQPASHSYSNFAYMSASSIDKDHLASL